MGVNDFEILLIGVTFYLEHVEKLVFLKYANEKYKKNEYRLIVTGGEKLVSDTMLLHGSARCVVHAAGHG